jgi:hypothetical protein
VYLRAVFTLLPDYPTKIDIHDVWCVVVVVVFVVCKIHVVGACLFMSAPNTLLAAFTWKPLSNLVASCGSGPN